MNPSSSTDLEVRRKKIETWAKVAGLGVAAVLFAPIAFAAPSDESDFFATDTAMPGLTGTMNYKDTLNGDDTTASVVTIDLVGANISKQQLMVLAKTIIFASVIPMNSD